MRSFQKAAQEVVLENNDKNDMQCGCSDVMRAEDGKLHSHLEWPYVILLLQVTELLISLVVH